MYDTHSYEGMIAETVTIHGDGGEPILAYFARPLGPGPFPGVVWIHHLPGWDEWSKEAARKLAYHGYVTICPDLYHREGPGSPEDVGAKIRAEGGVSDDRVMGDVEGAMRFLRALPYSNGKAGVVGTCSGGRHTTLAASRIDRFDAAADLWGGRVVMTAEELSAKNPVAPIDDRREGRPRGQRQGSPRLVPPRPGLRLLRPPLPPRPRARPQPRFRERGAGSGRARGG